MPHSLDMVWKASAPELLLQDSILFAEILDHGSLVAADPASGCEDQNLPWANNSCHDLDPGRNGTAKPDSGNPLQWVESTRYAGDRVLGQKDVEASFWGSRTRLRHRNRFIMSPSANGKFRGPADKSKVGGPLHLARTRSQEGHWRRIRTTTGVARAAHPSHDIVAADASCLLRNMIASNTMNKGAVTAQGKPRNSRVCEYVG